ncbi:MAG: hypothetical protein LBB98_08975 [Treponema sp.]|nr:hypothetical protein [Treponema sp.]
MNTLEAAFDSLRAAQIELALHDRQKKDRALAGAMAAIDADRAAILAANNADVERARTGGMKEALVDRLLLSGKRIDNIRRNSRSDTPGRPHRQGEGGLDPAQRPFGGANHL